FGRDSHVSKCRPDCLATDYANRNPVSLCFASDRKQHLFDFPSGAAVRRHTQLFEHEGGWRVILKKSCELVIYRNTHFIYTIPKTPNAPFEQLLRTLQYHVPE